MIIARMANLIAFKLPYYGIYGMTKVCGKKRREIWNKLPFRNLKSPTILPDGNIIICSWEDHSYEWEVYHNSPYDRFFKPQRGDIVVDAGAHVGFYTLKAAKEVGSRGHVIAIEPEDKNYELLTTNIRINKYKNITPIKSALSDFEGKARFFLKARSCSHSLIGKTWITPIVGSTEVTVTTLDNILEELDIKKVDLLKINVEGAELAVLKGCKKFLTIGGISNIVATPHPPFEQEAEKINRYLEAFGYRTKVADDAKFLYAFLI
jgi:FkbM family methyltransferase